MKHHPEGANVRWWQFWNPHSGAMGGLIVGLLLYVLLTTLSVVLA